MERKASTKEHFTISLLNELSPFFVNLSKSKLKYTLLLEPYFSSTIGFEIIDGRLCIGFPEKIYTLMTGIGFFGLVYIPNHSAFFLVIDFGEGKRQPYPIALRMYLRKERVNLLDDFRFAHIVRMDETMEFDLRMKSDNFTLPLRKEKELVWEKY